MAAIGKGIYNLLANNATISSNVGTKIMPNVINATAAGARSFPYITYNIVSVTPIADKDISAGGEALIDVFRVQVNIYATTYTLIETLSAAVIATLNRYNGTANTIKIQSANYITQADDYEKQAGSDGIYARGMDFNFRINNV